MRKTGEGQGDRYGKIKSWCAWRNRYGRPEISFSARESRVV